MPASSPHAADAVTTRHIDVDGHRLAYRVLNEAQRVTHTLPLVLAMRFRGVMDEWDPAFLDALAADRPVYWFDSAGIGLSEGETPDSIPGMARVLIGFVEAIGLAQVDLLGWSMGGYVVQSVVLQRPDLVRRLVVAGSGPGGVPDAPAAAPKVWAVAGKPVNDDEDFLYLFYPETPEGIAAGRAQLARTGHRAEPPEPRVRAASVQQQMAAFRAFKERDAIYPRLADLTLPILYANGVDDIMIHAHNSYAAAVKAPDAQLILYPKSGHGFLFQHHAQFVRDVRQFLNAE